MIYEYFCSQCNCEFEAKQSLSDPPLDHCPECKKQNKPNIAPKKLISKSSFQLVGGGWAKTGYS